MWDELKGVRNVRPGFRWGLLPGLVHAAVDQYILRGKAWWTLHHRCALKCNFSSSWPAQRKRGLSR